MLLRHRAPGIESVPVATIEGFEHLDARSIAVLRWLQANRIDFVLVGSVARAIRGEGGATGPVGIVPAPYGRNLDRLSRALSSEHARLRIDGDAAHPAAGEAEATDTMPAKMTADKLVGGLRWTLRCGVHDLDVEGRPAGVPRYQELLFEAGRYELTPEMSVEVASPEDIERYEDVRRAGAPAEIQISRNAREESSADSAT